MQFLPFEYQTCSVFRSPLCVVNFLQDPNLPKLCLFALRDIVKGEELSFDYKQQTGGSHSISLCCNYKTRPLFFYQSKCSWFNTSRIWITELLLTDLSDQIIFTTRYDQINRHQVMTWLTDTDTQILATKISIFQMNPDFGQYSDIHCIA